MEIELVEIRDFLAQRAPFDILSEENLNQLPSQLEVRYLRRGSPFPGNDSDTTHLYIIRSGAIELHGKEGELMAKLGEGDLFTSDCQLLDLDRFATGVAHEDTLLYLLPCKRLKALRQNSTPFDNYFNHSLSERLKNALQSQQLPDNNSNSQMSIEVAKLIQRQPITISMESTIQSAAQIMTDKNVSSVMVLNAEQQLVGVLTDSDLRRRCVAQGIDISQPVSSVMSSTLTTIQKNTLVINALLLMTRLHIHHLPVLDGKQVFGMLTATDLARQQTTNSAFIATDIRKAKSVEDLAIACQRLPALQLSLANASATALHIGEAISCITDSVTHRLIELAEEQIGPAPVPYAWVSGGSQARREQSSHSDQDNALIISDRMQPEHATYFEALAKFVCDGLNECGYVYCPGNAMAMNPEWRQPLAVWRGYFSKWIDTPEPMALMLSSIFFDLAPVCGDVSLFNQLHQEILHKSQQNRLFIAYMAANALSHRPPLGFFRKFVLIHDGEHDDTLDVKHRGIVPITDIARVLALSEGLVANNTTERLKAAMEKKALSREMGENLIDALEFIAALRINHQAEQIQQGKPADNFLPPAALSELERNHLKDAFKVIQTMQESLSSRFQVGRFA